LTEKHTDIWMSLMNHWKQKIWQGQTHCCGMYVCMYEWMYICMCVCTCMYEAEDAWFCHIMHEKWNFMFFVFAKRLNNKVLWCMYCLLLNRSRLYQFVRLRYVKTIFIDVQFMYVYTLHLWFIFEILVKSIVPTQKYKDDCKISNKNDHSNLSNKPNG
jgi:hypothetical protein